MIHMDKKICLIAALALYAAAPSALADIYKYVDKYGHVTLTDTPRNSNYRRLVENFFTTLVCFIKGFTVMLN